MYKCDRFQKHFSISVLDVRIHFKSTETFQYIYTSHHATRHYGSKQRFAVKVEALLLGFYLDWRRFFKQDSPRTSKYAPYRERLLTNTNKQNPRKCALKNEVNRREQCPAFCHTILMQNCHLIENRPLLREIYKAIEIIIIIQLSLVSTTATLV